MGVEKETERKTHTQRKPDLKNNKEIHIWSETEVEEDGGSLAQGHMAPLTDPTSPDSILNRCSALPVPSQGLQVHSTSPTQSHV